MRQHRCVPQEKWFALVAFEEIVDRLQALAADFQAFVAMPATLFRITMSHARGEAAFSRISFPPFSRLKADVTLLGQQFRQRRCASDMPQHLPTISSLRWIIAGHEVLMRIEARNDRHQA